MDTLFLNLQLTKSQRHTAYIIMLEEIESGTPGEGLLIDGFCFLANKIFQLDDMFENFGHVLQLFPEILKREPAKKYYPDVDLWFCNDANGWATRAEILKQCIEKTY